MSLPHARVIPITLILFVANSPTSSSVLATVNASIRTSSVPSGLRKSSAKRTTLPLRPICSGTPYRRYSDATRSFSERTIKTKPVDFSLRPWGMVHQANNPLYTSVHLMCTFPRRPLALGQRSRSAEPVKATSLRSALPATLTEPASLPLEFPPGRVHAHLDPDR